MLQLLASCLPTDKRVLAKMKELVTRSGVWRKCEMKPLLRDFVCNVLFAGQPEPPRFDSRFWPSDRTIMNTIYRTRHMYVLACSHIYYSVFLYACLKTEHTICHHFCFHIITPLHQEQPDFKTSRTCSTRLDQACD